MRLTDDGKTAGLIWNVAGRSELEFFDLANGERTPGPRLPAEIVGGLDFSTDGSKLAMVISGAAAPSDIWLLDRSSGDLRQVTHSPHAGVDLATLVRPELVSYAAARRAGAVRLALPAGGRRRAGALCAELPRRPRGPGAAAVPQPVPGAGSSAASACWRPTCAARRGFGKRFVNLDNGALRFDGIQDIEASVGYRGRSGHWPTRRGSASWAARTAAT